VFSTSLPSIAPVNPDQNFAVADVEENDVRPKSTIESGEGIVDIPHLSPKPTLQN
jgi:hypothetical protein